MSKWRGEPGISGVEAQLLRALCGGKPGRAASMAMLSIGELALITGKSVPTIISELLESYKEDDVGGELSKKIAAMSPS